MSIAELQKKISPILRANNIKSAAVFGSVSRGEDTIASDVDLMVELGKPMGMFAYMGFINEVEEALGKKVDIVTTKSVNKFLKPYILKDLKTIYEG